MIKTRTWIIIFVIIAAICAVFVFAVDKRSGDNILVEVVSDGEIIKEINLSEVKEEYSFRVESKDGGYNIVAVSPGKICISQADCPDKVCVHHSFLVNSESPIVCMPHKLLIRFKGNPDLDAIVR